MLIQYPYLVEQNKTEELRKHTRNGFLANNLLLASGLVVILSGLALQIGFHMGGPQGHQIGAHDVQSQIIQHEQ
jgi:hypothetical protein